MFSDIVLQVQQDNQHFSCERFSGVACPRSVYLAVCPATNRASWKLARELAAALRDVWSVLGSGQGNLCPFCAGRGAGLPLGSCQALDSSVTRKVLLLVSDGRSSDFSEEAVLDWAHELIVVLPKGSTVTLPPQLSRNQYAFFDRQIREVIPSLLSFIGIGEGFKIFISYRRTETARLAEQLFDALSREHFSVFLDRFSIDVGINFQNRLYQELADKAMVLLLESPDYLKSEWVQYEIDFAKKYRLGLYALNIRNAPKTPSLVDDYRTHLSAADFRRGGNLLRKPVLAGIMQTIKDEHAKALYRKKYFLQRSVLYALQQRGLTPGVDQHGFIESQGGRGSRVKIWAVARPPLVDDFHYTDTTHRRTRNIIVGPGFPEARRQQVNNWMSGKCNIIFVEESGVLQLAEDIGNGII